MSFWLIKVQPLHINYNLFGQKYPMRYFSKLVTSKRLLLAHFFVIYAIFEIYFVVMLLQLHNEVTLEYQNSNIAAFVH